MRDPFLRLTPRRRRILAALAALVAGAGVGLGQLPFALPWLALAALAGVLAAGVPAGPGAAFRRGWVLGLGHFLLTLHWITQPFLVDAERHAWMAPFGLAFMAGGLALFWGLAFTAADRLAPGAGPARRAAALVLAWTAAEIARSVLFTGFPWALVGHIWIDTPLAQSARVWGAHGLTLLTLTVATLAGLGLRHWRRPAGAALVAGPPVALALAGLALDPGPVPAADPAAPVIRLVQPNVPQAEKNDPDAIPIHTRRLLDLSAEAGAPDLVVWPETALPWLLDYMQDVLPVIAAAGQGAPVVSGIQRREGESRYYNSLMLLTPEARVTALYDKHHLVPFGEYIPFGEVLGRWGIRGLAASQGGGYSAGPGPALIDIPGIGPALPLICYEGIFAQEVNAAPGRARFLLLVTNDAWFGTFAGPYQHFALARLRAIEQGLPMVRVANTGISAMIDARGRVTGQLPLGVAGRLDLPLPPALPPTPYARTGDWPVLCVLLASLAGLLGRRLRNAVDPGAGGA